VVAIWVAGGKVAERWCCVGIRLRWPVASQPRNKTHTVMKSGHTNLKHVNAQWKTGVQRAQLDGHASHMKSQEPPEFLERVEPET
jgi:hypothetical protein